MNLDFRLPGLGEPLTNQQAQPASPSEKYDVIILGAGPAGMTAAVYSCRKALRTLLLSNDFGGQMATTSGIENYMGFHYITGPELTAKFETQIRSFPLFIAIPRRATRVEQESDGFVVRCDNGNLWRAPVLIVATGKRPGRLSVPGEQELTGKGVSYCATCDAPLFAGRDVAVIGGGNSALTAMLDLSAVARQVYAIHRRNEYRGDQILIDKVRARANIRHLMNCETVAILGTTQVAAIEVRNRTSGEQERYAVSGVFIEVGSIPNSELVQGFVELNERREIVVNCRAETSCPGLFAAGDVTSVPEKQIIIAAGEGAKAALAAHHYLLTRNR